jgi:hypothetical protein
MPFANHLLVSTYVLGQSIWLAGCERSAGRARRRPHDERGEGVISAAIAVLVMAFLGAAMWIGFKAMWDTTEDKVNEKVSEIGS